MRSYPQKIVLHSAVYAADRIYVLGGVDENNKPLKRVFFARVLSNGDLDPWVETRSLPNFRFRFPTATYDTNGATYLYIIGGYDGEIAHREVYYAKINSEGHLESWNKTTHPLPTEVYYHEALFYLGRLVVLGGKNDNEEFDRVYSAPVDGDGNLGEWTQEPRLPITLYRFASVVLLPGGVYILGGLHNDIYQSQVYHSYPQFVNYLPLMQNR